MPKITYWAIGLIGFGTLATDIWVAQGWLVVYVPFMSHAVLQGLFGGSFLTVAMAWLYFAFLKPPIFSKRNARRYAQTLYEYVLKGSDTELPTIATEVGRSAVSLLKSFDSYRKNFAEQRQKQERGEEIELNPGNFAYDILSMIGNRKFCRHVVSFSPITAIRIFQAASENRIYDAPLGQFSKNITAEAIMNPDSNLYHEDSRYESGLFGDLKPFTQAIFGSYRLVEALGSNYHSSPLDVDYRISRGWTSDQLEAYSRAVLTTMADRLECGYWHEHSFAIERALGIFDSACADVYKLDGIENGDPDIGERLRISVRFVTDSIDLLEKYEDQTPYVLKKPSKRVPNRDIIDQLVDLMSKILYNASGISDPWWPCWHIQHNTVWTAFFDRIRESKTRKVIAFRLRRLIYEEIVEFDKYKDLKSFKAARYLGISLNCLGVKMGAKGNLNRDTAALQKVMLRWLKKNFAELHDNHPTVAKACLMGGTSYDADKKQLVRTYASRADREPDRDYFSLD